MKKLQKLWCLTTLAATATFFLAGFSDLSVSANSTPQSIPFTQDWTNTGLITTNDDWTNVPGIEGFLGQDIVLATGVDPRTIVTPASLVGADLDVIANQTNPDTLTNGGVAEFEITNPSIALNGSGTADVPHIILNLNTTGQNNVRVTYNARDLDASADNAIQQINTQYRIGNTGNFINLPGGYIADATTQGTATQVTPVAVTLPAIANNKPLVQVRIMTTNAVGNDEWVGIDDITAAASATPARSLAAVVDLDGDLRTDYAVVRNLSPQLRWFYSLNGSGTVSAADWGLQGDTVIPEDFDGDGRDDIAVWRQAVGTGSAFMILQSSNGTARIENFGVIGDDATVAADYDGDGKSDLAVYRPGANPGQQSTWYYKGSLNNAGGNITFFPWGVNGDRVAPGDYDGDGKNDFVVTRDGGSGQAVWYQRLSNGGTVTRQWFGQPADHPVPGDYDGDSKTDLAVVHSDIGPTTWYIQRSSDSVIQQLNWGTTSDFAAQGDYDGDGKTDIAVWRTDGNFWIRASTAGVQNFQLGSSNDVPAAFYNRH